MTLYILKRFAMLAFAVTVMAGGFASAEAASTARQGQKVCPVHQVDGEGTEHVILLSGLNSPPAVWDDFVARTKKDYRFHRLPVPGFAGAAADTRYQDKPATALAEDVLHYITCNQLSDVTLVGHSFGGFAALKTALAWNVVIKQVIIVDALPFYPLIFNPAATVQNSARFANGFAATIKSQSDTQFAAAQQQAVRALVQGAEDQARIVQWSMESDRETMAAVVYQMMTEDLRPRLSEIKIPVTVIYAANSYAPTARVKPLYENAYAGLGQVNFVEIGDSYHFIMYDQPAAFSAAMMAAISGEE